MDSDYLNKCIADAAKADEEIAILQKHITDAENTVVPSTQSWKYKTMGINPKQKEKDELIARLKARVMEIEASVFHMRKIIQSQSDIMDAQAEIEWLDKEIAKDSTLYYNTGPARFYS